MKSLIVSEIEWIFSLLKRKARELDIIWDKDSEQFADQEPERSEGSPTTNKSYGAE